MKPVHGVTSADKCHRPECGQPPVQCFIGHGRILADVVSSPAYLRAGQARVSAKFLQRELGWRTAALDHCSQAAHGLMNEDPAVGGAASSRRTRPSSAAGPIRQVADRSTANPDKSLRLASSIVPAPKNKKGKHGQAVKRHTAA